MFSPDVSIDRKRLSKTILSAIRVSVEFQNDKHTCFDDRTQESFGIGFALTGAMAAAMVKEKRKTLQQGGGI
jgi:hypothetical protein